MSWWCSSRLQVPETFISNYKDKSKGCEYWVTYVNPWEFWDTENAWLCMRGMTDRGVEFSSVTSPDALECLSAVEASNWREACGRKYQTQLIEIQGRHDILLR